MSKTAQNIDDKVLKLFNLVKEKKNAIAKTQRPDWKTSCSFSYDPNAGVHDRVNLHVVRETDVLVDICSFLLQKKQAYATTSSLLGVQAPTKWLGYKIDDWVEDLKVRAAQLQVSEKKAELTKLEKRLDSLITVEQRRAMELEAIEKELAE